MVVPRRASGASWDSLRFASVVGKVPRGHTEDTYRVLARRGTHDPPLDGGLGSARRNRHCHLSTGNPTGAVRRSQVAGSPNLFHWARIRDQVAQDVTVARDARARSIVK
jgi:hypothetical protein